MLTLYFASRVSEVVSLYTSSWARHARLQLLTITDLFEANFNITEHPTARWTAQQVVDAFPCLILS
jgi:hypothetical protein